MTITTFGTLKSAIADFLNRSDLTAVIPTFVALAEAAHRRDIRDHRMITRGTFTLNSQYETLPTDWLETIRLTINSDPMRNLQQVSPGEMADRRGDDTAGIPQMFAHTGTEAEFWPTPAASYTATITYYAKVTALSADGDTNWLLTAAPDAYLYGALIHSGPYLKDDARVALWAGLYQQTLQALSAESERARFGSPLRMRVRAYG